MELDGVNRHDANVTMKITCAKVPIIFPVPQPKSNTDLTVFPLSELIATVLATKSNAGRSLGLAFFKYNAGFQLILRNLFVKALVFGDINEVARKSKYQCYFTRI